MAGYPTKGTELAQRKVERITRQFEQQRAREREHELGGRGFER